MVTAGVYMVARCAPLFAASPDAQLVVACIGGFTALLAALIALTQFDLKRILAYSTISQLGYMFLALGTGTVAGVTAGMFHLFTHAFFKALLFLGAGSVMHAMGNVIDIRRFGGLRHRDALDAPHVSGRLPGAGGHFSVCRFLEQGSGSWRPFMRGPIRTRRTTPLPMPRWTRITQLGWYRSTTSPQALRVIRPAEPRCLRHSIGVRWAPRS